MSALRICWGFISFMFILGGGSHACYVIPVDLEQLSTVIKLGGVCVCSFYSQLLGIYLKCSMSEA